MGDAPVTTPRELEDRQRLFPFACESEGLPPLLPRGSRVYLGHLSCERRIPQMDGFRRWLAMLAERDLRLTFVTPFLSQRGLERCLALSALLAEADPRNEILVNDWGLLLALKQADIPLGRSLGPLLLPQLRGQRMGSRMAALGPGAGASFREALRRPLLSPALMRPLLERFDVTRLELSRLQIEVRPPRDLNLPLSLHHPWIPATVTRYCPFALTEGGSKAWSGPGIVDCHQDCRRGSASLEGGPTDRPLFLHGNAVVHRSSADATLPAGFDRLVVDVSAWPR